MEAGLGLQPFRTRWFLPRYRALQFGEWNVRVARNVLMQGYWTPASMVEEMPALMRGSDTWMSLTPFEIESQEVGVALSHGHVAIMGLGLGWSAMTTALRDEVTRVTVIERDPEVLSLHRALDLFAQLPQAARAKLHLVQADAMHWRPDIPVDLLMPDIWLPIVNDGRVEEVRQMQANVRAGSIYFWGQELEIARHARAAGRGFDAEGVAATIADFDLPLIGMEYPGYPALLAIAAERWMRDRWLP